MTLTDLHNISNVLRQAFVSNKQTLEVETCQLAGIVHDDSKIQGEDGYYLGDKVEVKNTCWYGNSRLSGKVKFHDLSYSRMDEFADEEYWLVIACWNIFTNDVIELVFGFKFDDRLVDRLREKKSNGKDDPEISLKDYEYVFEEDKVKLFYFNTLTEGIYTKKLYTYLDILTCKESKKVDL